MVVDLANVINNLVEFLYVSTSILSRYFFLPVEVKIELSIIYLCSHMFTLLWKYLLRQFSFT